MSTTTICLLRTSATRSVAALALSAALLIGGCSGARDVADDAADSAARGADRLPGVGEPSFEATLTGEAEVPGPGDPDGTGSADVTLDVEDGEVCYEIEVGNVEPITMAHIHRGAAGESGPPVVDLKFGENGMDGCVTGADRAVVQQIVNNPAGFYVNVHNAPHPAGALRGQLRD